ncbi:MULTISPECIES: carbonic anhydrase [Micromonospora]|uniref:Carbonic anhydrase n=1 Tax=Micromonospora solifontis TaxID=2487138 RepID=A0ABX9WKF8_9ACTN|nr:MULTISPECIES: carbonic anhydrase [Micromonospora]NES14797.1 carbonic anhydrase [Micromonospora sp. PPF5-17B]NES35361.1 carbonic anhydrase [Micromonospora solifontis]NES56157.1 carbonic anhydrase [Micromonospora sp. PPF5-6]RNM00856.1 carbonic anhydrase [Micromonospora solifontis]
MTPITPEQALAELYAGNRRFVTGVPRHPNQDADHRAVVADGQHPFAVIVGCSDSRLAAEIIFDRGLGDLFVVRTAGHTVGPEVLGSVEYAVTVLGTPLIVVLGHDSCGAVQAARESVRTRTAPAGHLGALVDAVAPSLLRAGREGVEDVNGIVDIHIAQTVEAMLARSAVLAELVSAGRCGVVGMSYRLSAGEVRTVAEVPAGATAATLPGPAPAADQAPTAVAG